MNIRVSPANCDSIPWDDPRFEAAVELFGQGDIPGALELYDEILSHCPDHPRALHASGFLLHKLGSSGIAIERIKKALSLKPDFAGAHNNLGTVYMQTGQIPKARECFLRAAELAGDCHQFFSNYLLCLEYDGTMSAAERFSESLRFPELYFSGTFQRTAFANLVDPEKPLRIGLVSPDLGIQPVGLFLLPLLEFNDRYNYKFICYCTNERKDDVAAVLKDNSLEWRDVTCMSDEEISSQAELDRIDILVDLSGHTAQNRLPLFARRAAPLQITWLGYSATTAVPAMDYIFTDPAAVRADEERFFTEEVIRFAPTRFCYLPVRTVPDVTTPPSLHNGYCTFGSFNNLAKISPDVVRVWSMILKAVNGSRLILKNHFLADPYVCMRYLGLFSDNGISADRIEMRPYSPHADMLAEYADIDIALDPFPFCGGMTSCNALWMGVPVVTFDSGRPIGRQTKGFLAVAGLSSLVAASIEEYVTIAVKLASDQEDMAEIRRTLRERLSSSPLCDPAAFARNFETALRSVWRRWCKEQDPKRDQPWDDPGFGEAYGLFQTALNEGRHPEDAYRAYIRLLHEYPDHPRALHALGVVLHHLGESEDGIAHIRRSLLLKPDYADAYNNLGQVYNENNMYVEAEECFRRVVELRPDNHVAFKNLARCLLENGKRQEALSACHRALDIMPDYADAHLTICNVYMASGDAVKAFEFSRNANRLFPEDSSIHSNVVHYMNFLADMTQEDIYRESIRWGRRHADRRRSRRPHLNPPNPDKKLRIGYVSGDFKLHPVSYHLKPVIEHHDRGHFEVYLYSTFKKQDKMTELLKEHADQWRMVDSLADDRLEEMIRVDGIDILVDLAGHTAFNSLGLFALKPAPVQVSWLGYFNTTGLMAMDYLISDVITIPSGEERWMSEEVIRLPDGRFCYDPVFYKPDVAELPARKRGFVTFGSFNKLVKVTDETIILWSAVLRAVAKSRLVLKTYALNERPVLEKILGQFKEQGIEAHRLDLRDDSPYLEMLEQYADIDISLDTYPFNGGATTCESLWMGVPVVTLSGQTPISRQSASLLASCGLSGHVAYTRDEFVAIAKALATDIDVLANLRVSLRERLSSSALCNGRQFTANLENAYRDMWRRWCESRKGSARIAYNEQTSFGEYYNAAIDRMDEDDDLAATTLFKYALRKQPDSAKALNNLGISQLNLGPAYYRQAANSLRKAIGYDPNLGEAYKNLGRVLDQMKQASLCQEANDAFETAIRLLPEDAITHYMMANFKLSLGFASEALEFYRKAILLAPDNPEIHANYIFAMNYVPECSQDDILAESRLWDTRHSWKGPVHDFSALSESRSKLRIGYVSADFHKHPVGIFFQAVAVNHDRDFCEIFCYNNRKKQRTDEVYGVISKNVEAWRDVNALSDDDLFARIIEDRIDILVDLSGYTDGNRLKLFSRRAAPVQVSWLGYYNTTGITAMDYVISDEMTVPVGAERWYSEKVLRMPVSRFCYTPSYVCPDVEPLAALQKRRITFGSFNNFSKLTEDVIEAWSQIMLRVPKSRIVLKWKNFTETGIKEHYRLLFGMHGISSSRIEFRDSSPPFMMQDEYNDIDIALDPFPFSGGLTSCEALWMGVPVITFAGERPVARQTAGFLQAIGMEELIAGHLKDYIERAVNLAGDISYLAEMKAGLRQRFSESALCDGRRFTEDLENIYRAIWDDWKAMK